MSTSLIDFESFGSKMQKLWLVKKLVHYLMQNNVGVSCNHPLKICCFLSIEPIVNVKLEVYISFWFCEQNLSISNESFLTIVVDYCFNGCLQY